MNNIKDFEEQQLNNYIYAVCDIVSNNTNNLVDSDISSLIIAPPLDSMDFIKNKVISIGKKNNLIVNTESLDKILSSYRENVLSDLSFIKKYRVDEISSDVDKFKPVKSIDIIKVTKKRLNEIDKYIVSKIKQIINENVTSYLCSNYDKFYIDYKENGSLVKCLNSFFNKEYPKNLIDSIELKLLVKDTTLINGVKEQGERYIFTKNNSRLNDLD